MLRDKANPMSDKAKRALTDPNESLHLAGLVLVVLAGILAAVEAVQMFGIDRFLVDATAVLVLSLVALGAGFLAWRGPVDAAGILGIVAGVGFLLIFPETAGVLCLLGAVLMLVSTRLTEPTEEGRDSTSQTRLDDETPNTQPTRTQPPNRPSHGGQD